MQFHLYTAAIQLRPDIAAAYAPHVVVGGGEVEVRIHVAGDRTHLEIKAGFCRKGHIDLAAYGGDGNGLVLADIGKVTLTLPLMVEMTSGPVTFLSVMS